MCNHAEGKVFLLLDILNSTKITSFYDLATKQHECIASQHVKKGDQVLFILFK